AYAQMAVDTTVTILAGSQTAGCEADDKCWSPSTLTVAKGTTVTWKNEDGAGHTVTGATDPKDAGTWGSITVGGNKFDTAPNPFLIPPGAEWSFTFTEEGEFPYVCQVHPWMIGKVIVLEKMETVIPTEPEGEFSFPLAALTEDEDIRVRISWSPVNIEAGVPTNFKIETLDPETDEPTSTKLYDSMLFDPDGKHVDASHRSLQSKDIQTYTFETTGTFTLRLENINNTGQSVEFSLIVVPEFPMGVVAALLAVVFAGTIFATRKYRPLMGKY
ncbi:MAG: cupredoxin domain-containing protein, partial [Nitrososphaerales archaeon]